jgi:uncharacterized protein YgiM (DUF1202 family)
MRIYLVFLVLALSSLACMEQVATVTPTTQAVINVTTAVTPMADPTQTPSPTPTAAPVTPQAVIVSRAVVNVRQEPGGAVVGTLEEGDTVTVLGCTDDWCKIERPSGWVFRGCLEGLSDGRGCEAR